MANFSELDLGSTFLSIAVGIGFLGFGLVIIRFILTGINFIFENFKIKNKSNQLTKAKEKEKGFNN